ncbi:MAG: (E)-4-hydroxy-3-methylbut-2-enyl-diphosphate synthase [Synergistaceae bacterium]|nr:(E)-4-hydroxy-3-methylbut-2-enyl-diphosphate synthase [Synergistaceae bacterium]
MCSRKVVNIDGLKIGGNLPIRVESMLKAALSDLDSCILESEILYQNGCELIRVAFPDTSLSDNFEKLIKFSKLKIMADIHFDHNLAVAALELGCRAIRINPGNMSDSNGIKKIVDLAKRTDSVIRIGANGGSLNNKQILEAGNDRSLALFNAVEEQLELLLNENFDNIIISAKSSNVCETLRANALLSQKYTYPIHIGITEAGSGISGIVKSSIGIGIILSQGIGDTIRVSLTAPGVEEVKTAYHILRTLELRQRGYNLISCPTCGRKRVDVEKLTRMVKNLLPENLPDGLTIAVMGCEVNGPREASEADIGIAGTPYGFVMFKKGVRICSGKIDELPEKLKRIILEI